MGHGALMTPRHGRLTGSAAILWCVLAASAAGASDAQHPQVSGTLYVLPRHPVYAYLERMSAKGLLPHAPLSTRPWTRTQLADALIEISPEDACLTDVDRADWRFYAGEFADEILALGADSLLERCAPAWWSRAAGDRSVWKQPLSTYRKDDAEVRLWVAGGLTAQHDTSANYRRHAEIGGWARLGEHWGAQAAMRDVAVWGPDVTPPPAFDPTPGVAHIDGDTSASFYYDDTEALVTYGSRFFTASVGVYPLLFGPGTHAQVILSDKAPPLPQVRLTVCPWPWLSFTYVHMTLQSGVPDSESFWHRYDPENTGYAKKYYVAHRLELTALRGIDLALGESVVYGGRGPELRYLIPIIPFRAAQHAEGDLDNLQMWADIAATRLPWTRLYGALLIDELSLNALLKEDMSHNWWAWQVGAQVADLWGFVPDVDLCLEYTRAHPWVYHHEYPWNTYDTWALKGNEAVVGYPLGFWQGHNGDFLRGDLIWQPRRGLRFGVWASQARRGGEGTVEEQYNPPAESFLFGPVTRTREIGVEASWELRRDLVVRAMLGHSTRKRTSDAESSRRSWTTASFGVTYNVW